MCLNENRISDSGIICNLSPALSNAPRSSALEFIQLRGNHQITFRGDESFKTSLQSFNCGRVVQPLQIDLPPQISFSAPIIGRVSSNNNTVNVL